MVDNEQQSSQPGLRLNEPMVNRNESCKLFYERCWLACGRITSSTQRCINYEIMSLSWRAWNGLINEFLLRTRRSRLVENHYLAISVRNSLSSAMDQYDPTHFDRNIYIYTYLIYNIFSKCTDTFNCDNGEASSYIT